MIKATELRLNNWVNITGVPLQLAGEKFLYILAEDGLITRCEPIPLTPEILEKAGFERRWGNSWEKNNVEIEQSEEQKILGGYILLNGEERSHWPNVYFYLHQLQNLYFSLTNSELTIQL